MLIFFMDPLSTNLPWDQDMTSKRSLLILSRTCFYEMMVSNTNVDDDDDLVENQCTLYARPDGSKIAKQTKKNGGVGAYKEELIVLVEVKMDWLPTRRRRR